MILRGVMGLLAVCIALAHAPVSPGLGQGAVTLRMKFHEGQVLRYRANMQMTMTMTMGQNAAPISVPTTMTAIQEWRVKRTLPNGGAEVTITTSDSQVSAQGQPPASRPIPPYTVIYDGQGRMKAMSGPALNNPAGQLLGGSFGGASSGLSAYLPSHAVKPGDTWTQAVNLPMITGATPGSVRCAYVRDEAVGRLHTALIHTITSAPLHMMLGADQKPTRNPAQAVMMMNGTMHSTGDTDFAIAEGLVARVTVAGSGDMTMTLRIPPGQQPPPGMPHGPMKMSMKMTMSMQFLQ